MAIYHFSVQIFQRSAGRSAFAGAMYRAGEKGFVSMTGREHNYTEKGWVTHTEILLPEYVAKHTRSFMTAANYGTRLSGARSLPKHS